MRKKNSALYRVVYRGLRGRILSGEYEAGAKIETEQELTEQFGASVITIRQAEQMLVDEGLLDKQQGRGTFVPANVVRHLKILCVCGLKLTEGLQQRMGGYVADVIVLAQQEAARRQMEFETVWLATFDPERARVYCEEPAIMEYWGFLFLACGPTHPLLRRVQELKLRYATVSAYPFPHNSIRLDFEEGIRLALGQFGAREKPLIMGIDSLQDEVASVLRDTGRAAQQVYLPHMGEGHSFETAGYLRTMELIKEQRDLSRMILLDDVIAQGATRALLKAGYAQRQVKLAVICGREEIVPLGLPVTYVVHDIKDEARQAFSILEQQRGRTGSVIPAWRSGFRVLDPCAAGADVRLE